MPEHSYRVAFIGTGGRSVCYAREYAPLDNVEVVALADPSAENRRTMATNSGLTGDVAEYDDWRELLREHQDLDGVVIGSPNFAHADQAIACLERGLPIVLEKPIAHLQEDCERILAAERANDGRTLVGFVLRSAPFYLKAQEVIRQGTIGQIVSVEAHELVGYLVTSLMMRGEWRRYQATSGGSMLEKCCHDMDILNWLIGSRPVSLNSYGGRRIFTRNPALPEHCEACGVRETCRYSSVESQSTHEHESEKTLHRFMQISGGRCIYNLEKDIADVQSVAIEYENGAIANFLMNFHVADSRGSRNLGINGDRGSLYGDIDELKLTSFRHDTGVETVHETPTDGSGHGGGDRRHALELVRMMEDPAYRPAGNAQAGYLSAVMCFAADISRRERRRVDFRYGSHDLVTLI